MNVAAAVAPIEQTLGILVWSALCAALGRRALRSLDAPNDDSLSAFFLAAAAGLAALTSRSEIGALAAATCCCALVVAAIVDGRSGYLVDLLTLPATIAVVACAVATDRVQFALAGAVAVAGPAAALVATSRGKWLGLGDAKALYSLGASFGVSRAALAVFIACLCGIAFVAVRSGRLAGSLAFGPFLALGAIASVVAAP